MKPSEEGTAGGTSPRSARGSGVARIKRLRKQIRRRPLRKWLLLLQYYLPLPRRSRLQLIEGGDLRLYVDRSDMGVSRELLREASYEGQWTRFVRSALEPGDVVVDIGANIGYYTVLMARRVGPAGLVVAFEPEEHNFGILEKNIALNELTHVRAVRAAVSDKEGSATLFVDRRLFGVHSLSRENMVFWGRTSGCTVPTLTLDSYLERERLQARVRFVKIDAQGAEGLILTGATGLLAQDAVTFMIEMWPKGLGGFGWSPAGVVDRFVRQGFESYTLNRRGTLEPMCRKEILRRAAAMQAKWASFNVVFSKGARLSSDAGFGSLT
jgi:FkbM family methyltransferase